MNKTNVGVVGNGVVGSATAACYRDYWINPCNPERLYEVRVFDKDPSRSTHTIREVLLCDVVFVCLPTPESDLYTEGTDLSHVEEFFHYVRGVHTNLVLRSTVPIGTTRRLRDEYDLPNLVHSPEFLTARTAVEDAANPRLNVLGDPDKDKKLDKTVVKIENGGARACAQLYHDRWPGADLCYVTSDESEAVKLFMNSFFAVKVAYWNEVRHLADRLELDYNAVREAVVAEGRVGGLHTHVPGPDGKFGFGGSCLPKDLAMLISQMDALDLQPRVCRAARDRNELLDRSRTI